MIGDSSRPKSTSPIPPSTPDPADRSDARLGAAEERRLSDFVRRAGSAVFEAAGRSKEDILRAATSEIRSWLDHLDLDKELIRALSRMTVEVKAEIRFRPKTEGTHVVEASNTEVTMKRDGPAKREGTP